MLSSNIGRTFIEDEKFSCHHRCSVGAGCTVWHRISGTGRGDSDSCSAAWRGVARRGAAWRGAAARVQPPVNHKQNISDLLGGGWKVAGCTSLCNKRLLTPRAPQPASPAPAGARLPACLPACLPGTNLAPPTAPCNRRLASPHLTHLTRLTALMESIAAADPPADEQTRRAVRAIWQT